MKRPVIIILIILALVILGLLSPWTRLNLSFSQLLGFGSIDEVGGLKVFSLVGEIEVYVDNEFQGSVTPESGALEVVEVKPGLHQIRLKRKSNPDGSYYELNRTIKFEAGVDVIVSYELGPSLEFSEGHIFYAEERFDSNTTKINITSFPEGAQLYLDNNFIGETPIPSIDISLTDQHTIRVEKIGYDTIEFKFLPDTQEERDKLKGYNLHLDINMFLIPLKITTSGN